MPLGLGSGGADQEPARRPFAALRAGWRHEPEYVLLRRARDMERLSRDFARSNSPVNTCRSEGARRYKGETRRSFHHASRA